MMRKEDMNQFITQKPYEESSMGARFQAVFPKRVRAIAKNLTPGTKLTMIPVDTNTVIVTTKSKNWAEETYGMLKGAWTGDATELIINLRKNDWE